MDPDLLLQGAPPPPPSVAKFAKPNAKRKRTKSLKHTATTTAHNSQTIAFLKGNYSNYYNFRYSDSDTDGAALVAKQQKPLDHRLKLLSKKWFVGQSYLDIGCNSGKFTFAVYETFGCASALGVDVEPKLIKVARRIHDDSRPEQSKGSDPSEATSSAQRSTIQFQCIDVMADTFHPAEQFGVCECSGFLRRKETFRLYQSHCLIL